MSAFFFFFLPNVQWFSTSEFSFRHPRLGWNGVAKMPTWGVLIVSFSSMDAASTGCHIDSNDLFLSRVIVRVAYYYSLYPMIMLLKYSRSRAFT